MIEMSSELLNFQLWPGWSMKERRRNLGGDIIINAQNRDKKPAMADRT